MPRPLLARLAGKDAEFWAYFAIRVVVALGGIVALERLVAALSREAYGQWGYLRAIGAMLVPMASLSLPAAMMRTYFDRPADDHEGHRDLATTVTLLHVGICALLAGAASVGYALGLLDTVEWQFYAGLTPGMVVASLVTYMARTRNDVWLFFVHRMGETLGFLALLTLIGHGWLRDGGALSPLAAVVRAYSVMLWAVNAIALLYYARVGLLSFAAQLLDRRAVLALVRFSAPLSGTYLLGWGLASSDVWLLRKLSALTEVADYVFAVGIANAVSLVTSSALTDWPRFYYAKMRDDPEGSDGTLREKVRRYLWLHILAMVLVRVAARFAYPLLGADAYTAGLRYVDLLVLGNFFFLLGNLLAAGIGYAKATHLTLLTFAVPGVLNVGLNVVFLGRYGAEAAAWTTLVAYAAFALASHVAGARFHRFVRVGELAVPVLVALAVALAPLP